jgi:hypothetical protein
MEFDRRIRMRTIRTTTISILAVSVLAGSAVGVAAQDEASMEPAEVTGRATFVVSEPLVDPVMSDAPGGIRVGDGMVVVHIWDTNDPRLDGEATRTVNFRFDADFSNGIESEAMVLTNDGGSWVGDGWGYGMPGDGGGFSALSGSGGYEGLSAFVVRGPNEGDGWDLKGIIFPSERPEIPELYVAE